MPRPPPLRPAKGGREGGVRRPSAGAAQSYLAVGGTDRDSDIGSQHDCECRSQFNSESTVEGGGGRGEERRKDISHCSAWEPSHQTQRSRFNEVRNLRKRPFRGHKSTHLLSVCTNLTQLMTLMQKMTRELRCCFVFRRKRNFMC